MNPLCDDPLPKRHHPEQPLWRENSSAGASKEIAATGYAGHAATENGRWPRGDRKYEGAILITLRKRERVTPFPASLARSVDTTTHYWSLILTLSCFSNARKFEVKTAGRSSKRFKRFFPLQEIYEELFEESFLNKMKEVLGMIET